MPRLRSAARVARSRHRLQKAIDVLHVVVDRRRQSHPMVAESHVHVRGCELLWQFAQGHVLLREGDRAARGRRRSHEGEAEAWYFFSELLEHRLAIRANVLEAER